MILRTLFLVCLIGVAVIAAPFVPSLALAEPLALAFLADAMAPLALGSAAAVALLLLVAGQSTRVARLLQGAFPAPQTGTPQATAFSA